MAFEKVEGSYNMSAKISIRKSETIGINEASLQTYFEECDYVEIYFDEENNQIGFRSVDEKTNDSYKISEQSSGGTVGCTSFLKQNDLVPQVTTRYAPQQQKLNDDVDLVVIDLDDPIDTYGDSDDDDDDEDQNEEEEEQEDEEE